MPQALPGILHGLANAELPGTNDTGSFRHHEDWVLFDPLASLRRVQEALRSKGVEVNDDYECSLTLGEIYDVLAAERLRLVPGRRGS